MSGTLHRSWFFPLIASALFLLPLHASGSAFVRGAYYRLGEDDPGAGGVGNNPTIDSFTDALHLSRFGTPHYSSNTPALYAASKLSMAFANSGLGGPAFLGYYGRSASLPTDQGYALEAWVNTPDISVALDPPAAQHLVAYNGTPGTNGFGFYEIGGNYVARIGSKDHPLGPTASGTWHHLAYIQSFGNASYYFDGKLVSSTSTDSLPVPPSGGFWLGGLNSAGADTNLFNGYVDEVRYQSFNPIAAGAFDPAAFLIDAPDPSQLAVIGLASLYGLTLRRRPRRPRTAR